MALPPLSAFRILLVPQSQRPERRSPNRPVAVTPLKKNRRELEIAKIKVKQLESVVALEIIS